jgi:hypothetical protein
MAISLTRCDGGGHVHIHVDGAQVAVVMFGDLLAGNVASDEMTVKRVQAAVLVANAQDFDAMQAAVEALP